jgi:hypothetical protein
MFPLLLPQEEMNRLRDGARELRQTLDELGDNS